MEIEYKGIIYTIEQNENESDDTFYERMWIVVKQEPKSLKELNEAVYNSNLWTNYKLLGCRYSKEINHLLENIDRKIYS